MSVVPLPVPAARTRTEPPVLMPVTHADRGEMRRLIAERGFDGAIDDLAMVVAVAVVPDEHPEADHRMEQVATVAGEAILEVLVKVARTQAWRGAR